MLSLKWLLPVAALALQAQAPAPPPQPPAGFQVELADRSVRTIDYREVKSSTKVDFKGTNLAPKASGSAEISRDASVTTIRAKVEGLPDPNKIRPEFLTYVLWAVAPDGKTVNLGEIVVKPGKGKGSLKATVPLNGFGLVVTAEPYYAVTMPCDAMVLENTPREGSITKLETASATYKLFKDEQFQLDPTAITVPDKKTPREVLQARNALAMAVAASAEKYAPEALTKAQEELTKSQDPKASDPDVVRSAREATQLAENARVGAIRARRQEAIENERKRAQAALELANQQALQAQAEAQKAQAEAQKAAAAASQANTEVAKTREENARMKAKLKDQLNSVLQTRATAEGLIMNLSSGISFKTGKWDLLPAGREKLAKVAGIILSHPGLKLQVHGYTDSTGTEDKNLKLSEKRAQAASDYLVAQGIAPGDIQFKGRGVADPIDSNDTSAGRANNRRVELVVSGEGLADE